MYKSICKNILSMVVRFLETNKDPFIPKDDDKEVLGLKIPYLSATGSSTNVPSELYKA